MGANLAGRRLRAAPKRGLLYERPFAGARGAGALRGAASDRLAGGGRTIARADGPSSGPAAEAGRLFTRLTFVRTKSVHTAASMLWSRSSALPRRRAGRRDDECFFALWSSPSSPPPLGQFPAGLRRAPPGAEEARPAVAIFLFGLPVTH